jgi:Flp pilus assembly protein TadG
MSGMKKPTASQRQRGQSLAEFAIGVPLLLLVVLAILEFGVIFFDQITVSSAARSGARAGALHQATAAQAQAAAQDAASGLISCSLQGTPTASYSGSAPQQVRVTVTCTYRPLTPVGQMIKWPLTSTGVQTVEQ